MANTLYVPFISILWTLFLPKGLYTSVASWESLYTIKDWVAYRQTGNLWRSQKVKVKVFIYSGPKRGTTILWLHGLFASIWTGRLPLFSVPLFSQDSPSHLATMTLTGHSALLGWLAFLTYEMGGLDQMNWSLRCFVTEFLPSWAVLSCSEQT